MPSDGKLGKVGRGALQVVGGVVPLVGGLLSAAAGAWSENEQDKVNKFFDEWVRMLQDEIREKEATILEIMARLNLQDDAIAARVESREFQSLVKKSFRDWAGAESEDKRVLIRNLLSNAAASSISSDDVVRMFIDWIGQYSELHFRVIGAIYTGQSISRGAVWEAKQSSPDSIKCVVIVGRSLSDGNQKRSFELFRNACKDVEVITFDELLEKLRRLHAHLAPPAAEDPEVPF